MANRRGGATLRQREDKELSRLRRRVAELEAAAADHARTAEAQRRIEARFRPLFQSHLMGIFFGDLAGGITEANDLFLQMVGHDRGDLPLRWDTMTPPEWRHLDEVKLEEITTTGEAVLWEKEYFRKDGSRVPILVGAALLEGSQSECIAIVLDRSEKRRVDAALRASEERYRELYENIPLMYFTLDTEGSVLSVNAHGARELGYSPAELIGQSVLKVFHPNDRKAVVRQLEELLSDPEKVAKWEFRKVRKDGSGLWVQEAARAVRGADGRTVVLVACEDVTERKEAERQVREHEDKLRAMASELALAEERERRRISRGLHDHIGHPLAAIKMRLGELRAAAAPAARARAIDEIEDILLQAIRETRTLTFELSPPVLYELGLEAAIRSLGEQMEQRSSVGFAFERAGVCRPLAKEVELILYRIVEELLFNVVKHARAERVIVTLGRNAGQVQVTVEDDGVGFEVSQAGDAPALGDGLGLFSIRERLDHLGGSLRIDSLPGSGTRVAVTVPRKVRRSATWPGTALENEP